MGEKAPSEAESPREPSGSWSVLFNRCADPIFLLSRRRQIRFVNPAWEALTGKLSESVRGLFCLPLKKKGTGPQRALLQVLAPPPEVMGGAPKTVRRPAPPARLGPPWWDITFIPLPDSGGLTGVVGFIRVVEAPAGRAASGGLSEALIALRQKTATACAFERLSSETAVMERIEAQARLAAQIRTPVWIVGEPGTGKETLGRVIHFNGITAEQTFLCLDCLALQPYLLRNMLFGHLGQTGAQLGTLFVKDPSSMSRDLQEELLNWFDEQDDPPRVIVASRDCTGEDIRSGRILPQFHSTLNVLEIRLPPLRERIADLPALASEFIRGETKSPEAAAELTQDAFDVLNRHSWPGNLRELKAVLGDALESAKGGRIDASHLPLFLRAKTPAAPRASLNLDEVLEAVEARMIRLALQKTRGNKSEAADLLGIPRARLWRRIETLKIEGFQLE